VAVSGNDLLLDPSQLVPPPVIRARLVAVRVERDEVIQSFGHPTGAGPALTALAPPDTAAPNYMYFRGGTLRFGKLFMVHSDMQIIDLDPGTPFDFSIDDYDSQLIAGYSRARPNMSLEAFMPDFASVRP
jgi:hypothetical protein